MRIREALGNMRGIALPAGATPALKMAAAELSRATDAPLDDRGSFHLRPSGSRTGGVYLELLPDGSGELVAEHDRLLLGFTGYLLRNLLDEELTDGRTFPAAFPWLRATYDFFLTQEGRIQRGLDKATYLRRLATRGFTHVEVNGLAFPMGRESGPAGEAYPMFYTYCPALDQFVSSKLNRGLYPEAYLAANLRSLKQSAELAHAFGLVPGLLCFEPRSVPEEFFARYPMLRGARVDHPFRSFKPRYNMTITHPMVRAHYAEMLGKLQAAVPQLGYLSIWTNDSGAGFEHTQSLYVGRNGGAYLIREWKDQNAIAAAAGENALRFMRELRDAARRVNPDFRVITRLESFYGEHEIIWQGLGDGLDVETASLIGRGWEMPYHHPRYRESRAINAGSIYQLACDAREEELLDDLDGRGARAHFYFGAGPWIMFAPLLGIPYPHLTHRRLRLLHGRGVRHLANLGGACPPELVPFDVNHEMVSIFQFNPDMDPSAETARIARAWAGPELAETLCAAWRLTEEAILAFPVVTPLYATYGFTWYRLWARPLVPNIAALVPDERAYYEDFMCTTPHNPNNVDLRRDVLFELASVDWCRRSVQLMDEHVWRPLDDAIARLAAVETEAQVHLGPQNVIRDSGVRLRALRCWLMTQRNVAAWIAGVHGYLDADDDAARAAGRETLHEMHELEMENSRSLLELLGGETQFMALSGQGETPLMYADNLPLLVRRRMEIMEAHAGDEPHIDPDHIENQAGRRLEGAPR